MKHLISLNVINLLLRVKWKRKSRYSVVIEVENIFLNDRGREYFPIEFTLYCEENDIIYQMSTPYTRHQNELAKRKK